MTAIMDLSFPGQRTITASSCIPHDSVYMPGPRAGKSENGFFRCDTWLQILQNDSKICEAEVTPTPLINKICKPCTSYLQLAQGQAEKLNFFAHWTLSLDTLCTKEKFLYVETCCFREPTHQFVTLKIASFWKAWNCTWYSHQWT